MSTPQTDQRLELLRAGHSNCLPKWEDFAKDLEAQLEHQRAQTTKYAAEREHNAMQALAYKAERDAYKAFTRHVAVASSSSRLRREAKELLTKN